VDVLWVTRCGKYVVVEVPRGGGRIVIRHDYGGAVRGGGDGDHTASVPW